MPIERLSFREVQAYELNTRPEVLEFIDSNAAYLGGFIESSGVIYFNEIERGNWYPRFEFANNNRSSQEQLAGLLDGSIFKVKGQKSWRLFISKSGLVQYLGNAIAPFAPSRGEIVNAVNNWQEAESMDERAEIVQSYHQDRTRRFTDLGVKEYEPLVRMPEFVAGVFDGCASSVVIRERYPEYLFYTDHRLLTALQDKFGGSLNITNKAGTQKTIRDIAFISKHDVWMLHIARSEAVRGLLHFIKPHVITKGAELERGLELLEAA